jgi:BASS family bile acid:Na+ symporter
MDIAQLAKLALSTSIPLLVVALGMRATFADATMLFREFLRPPYRLSRAVLALSVAVPVVAVVVAKLFGLPAAVKLAILAMAVSPIPPLLPRKQLKSGAHEGYVFGLLVALSLTAIVTVPVGVDIIGRLFDRDAGIGLGRVVALVGTTILLPLAVGLALRKLAPRVADRVGPWVARVGNALLVAGLVPTLLGVWPSVLSLVGDGSVLAIALVVVLAIAIGHAFGGPDYDERTALGIASAMRHPGMALAIGSLNMPGERRGMAGVLLYLAVAVLATTLYGKWRASRDPAPAAGA